MDAFQMITGPKTDLWLVRTVGLLLLVIGGVFLLAAWQRQIALQTAVLALGSALSVMAIEVIYVAAGKIRRIYLLDAGAELMLASLWMKAWTTSSWKENNSA